MIRIRYTTFICIIVTLAALLIPIHFALAQTTALPGSVKQLLKKHKIPLSAVSLTIRNTNAGQSLLSVNPDVSRNPASVIKILTTMASLELLGPQFQWHTKYFRHGNIENGVLNGDLFVQGSGDPFITLDQFWLHLMSLRLRGVQQIQGDLVIDNSAFNLLPHDRSKFDGKGQRLYNVGPNAVLTNFSATRFVFEPSSTGVRIFADPPLENLSVQNNIKAQAGKCISRNSGWSYKLDRQGENTIARFSGNYRSRCGVHSISRSILDNNTYTYQLFRTIWTQMGGKLSGTYRIARTPENAQLLVSHPSKPLADIVTSINKYSNNVMARQLLLTIGSSLYGAPATIETGVNGINSWLTANGISMPGLLIENGSGLSRKSRVTANGLTALLQHAWHSNYRPEFMSSLSLAALDGTMRKRLKKSPLRSRARIKTGLIKGVRSMAGYVHARNRQHYSVAMMIESPNVNFWIGNQIQDAVLEWVYGLN